MNSDKDKNSDGGKGSKRGFASMDEDKQREIASKGGKAAHEKGSAHRFNSEEASRAGQKGGAAHGKAASGNHQSKLSTSGGSSEQHTKSGGQSGKNG